MNTDMNRPRKNEETGNNANNVGVAIDGFSQVLEMLKIADPAFRESLLRRLSAKDPTLARTLRRDLSSLGI
ncbi:hypothetical protein WDW86_01345 [Bdellovibrionota bacterium FG-2]